MGATSISKPGLCNLASTQSCISFVTPKTVPFPQYQLYVCSLRISVSFSVPITSVYPSTRDDNNALQQCIKAISPLCWKRAVKKLALQGLIPGHSGGVNAHHMLHSRLEGLDHRASGMGSNGAGTVVSGVKGVLHPDAVGLDPGPVGPCPTPGTNPDIPACWYTSGGANSHS